LASSHVQCALYDLYLLKRSMIGDICERVWVNPLNPLSVLTKGIHINHWLVVEYRIKSLLW
jgi:hypothetical protein